MPTLLQDKVYHTFGDYSTTNLGGVYYGKEGNDPHEETRQHLLLFL